MAQVAIQLSDEDLERLKAHADALDISTEAMATEVVMDLLHGSDPLIGFNSQAEYEAFIQEGIDSADRGELLDWEVVKADLSAMMARRLAEVGE